MEESHYNSDYYTDYRRLFIDIYIYIFLQRKIIKIGISIICIEYRLWKIDKTYCLPSTKWISTVFELLGNFARNALI